MPSWSADASVQSDPPSRPDDLHFDDGGAEAVAARFLGPIAVAAGVT